jgi:hypothetical protein
MDHDSKDIDALTESDIGCQVETQDGARLGTVKAVHGDFFEVDVSNEEDYWLAAKYIGSYEDRRIRLSLPRQEVDKHRLHAPGVTSMTGQVGDAGILSEEEALTQRERMEAELIRQRGKMHTDVRQAKD